MSLFPIARRSRLIIFNAKQKEQEYPHSTDWTGCDVRLGLTIPRRPVSRYTQIEVRAKIKSPGSATAYLWGPPKLETDAKQTTEPRFIDREVVWSLTDCYDTPGVPPVLYTSTPERIVGNEELPNRRVPLPDPLTVSRCRDVSCYRMSVGYPFVFLPIFQDNQFDNAEKAVDFLHHRLLLPHNKRLLDGTAKASHH